MKATKIVLWVVLAGLLALAGAVAYLPAYLQGHKDLLEAGATRALGRSVEIGGVGLEWWLTPLPRLSLRLEGLRVHNPEWAQGAFLVRAERVDAQLDLGALLRRRVAIEGLLIRGADLHLERGAAGENNWTFAPGGGGGLHVGTVRVLDSSVAYRRAPGDAWSAAVSRLDLSGLGGAHLELDADATIRDARLSLTASSGPTGGAPSAGRPFGIRAQVEGSEIDVSGHAAAPFDLAGFEAQVRLKGPTAIPLGRLLGADGLPDGPFALDFRLERAGPEYRFDRIAGSIQGQPLPEPVVVTGGEAAWTAEGAWSAALEGRVGERPATLKLAPATGSDQEEGAGAGRRLSVTATLADSRFAGDLRLSSNGAPARIEGELQLGEVELGAKQSAPSTAGKPAATWSEATLPLAALTKVDADLSVAAEALTWERVTATKLSVRALLDSGRLRLDGLTARLPGMTVTAEASLDAGTQPPALTMALHADRVDLPQALGTLAAPKIEGTFDKLDLKVAARGDTPAALIRTLEGALTAAAARVTRPAEKGRTGLDVRLTGPKVILQAGKAVRLQTGMVLEQQAFDLDLRGGTLADLLLDDRPWPRIQVVARGKLGREMVQLKGQVGPLAALLAGRDVGLDLNLALGKLTGTLAGSLARFDALDGSRMQVEASGPDASLLATLLPLELPAKPFKASARLQGQKGRLDVSALKATLGTSDITGQVRIRPGARPRVDATLASRLLELTPYVGTAGEGGGKTGSSQPLPLEGLKTLDGELHLTAGHVRAGDFGIDDGSLDATLDAGHLVLSAKAGQERMSADLDLRPEQTQWRFDLRHKGKLSLSWLIEAENDHPLSDVPLAVDMRLSGVGDSMQTLLGSARGRVDLVLGAGRLGKTASSLPLGGILLSLLGTLNPVDWSREAASLQCAVLQFDVADGIATSKRGLAVQTASLNILGGGAIKLRTSEIELRFKTAARKGLGLNILAIADKIVYVTGTLQDPRAAIDPTGLLVHGTAAWATSGLSLVYDQLASRLTASGNPCDTVLRKGGRD